MRYAIEKKEHQSLNSFRYWNNLDELIINNDDDLIFRYPRPIGRFPQDKSLVIRLHNIGSDTKEIINKWKEVYEDLTLAIDYKSEMREDFIELCEETGSPWFFSDYCFSQDLFKEFTNYNISQIYIVEGLGFQLEDIKRYFRRNEKDIKIRVLPNIGQAKYYKQNENEITKFFIRPEDTKFYEDIVDTFELVSIVPDRYSVIFQIYKEQDWKGMVNEIIGDVRGLDIKNKEFSPYFGYHRINCYKKCTYGLCNFCQTAVNMAKIFDTANIEVETPKEDIGIELTNFESIKEDK